MLRMHTILNKMYSKQTALFPEASRTNDSAPGKFTLTL